MRRLGFCLLLLLVFGAGICVAAKKPCRPALSNCPKRGCAKPNTPNAISNILKHNLEPKGDLKTLTFADFKSLQSQVENLFAGKYHKLTKPDRVRLRSLQAGGQTVGEGDFGEIIGFVAVKPATSKPHANTSGESVNCRLTKAENNDFHISITPTSDGSEYAGIVAEMIPQQRNSDWTEARLRQVQQAHRPVRVRGQLFFDNHHVVNDDPAHNISNQPKRMSLWEIHPVTQFEVCATQQCGPNGTGWKVLENWP